MSSTPDLLSYRPNRQISLVVWMLLVSVGSFLLLGLTIGSSLSQNIEKRNEHITHTTRIIERGLTRTLESVETTLLSLAEDLRSDAGDDFRTPWVRERISRAIQFSPHIRQVVLLRNDRVLVDSSRQAEGLALDLERLQLSGGGELLNSGLQLGNTVPQRFLPIQGEAQDPHSRRSLIPLSFVVAAADNRPRISLVVALNAAYLQKLLDEGNFSERKQHSALLRADGTALLQNNLLRQWHSEVQTLLTSGLDEQTYSHSGSGVSSTFSSLRLSSRYPVAVLQQVQHRDTLMTWLQSNRMLLTLLLISVSAIIATTLWLIWDSRRRRVLEAEVGLLFEAIDQSPVTVVITDNKRIIRYINPAFTRLMGVTEAQAVGRSAAILKSGETPERTYELLRRALAQGRAWSGEFINRKVNGELITVACTISSVHNRRGEVTHHVGVMADISANKDAERELRIAAASFEVQAGMMVTDAQGKILRVNPAFTQMTGYSIEEVVGQSPAILKSGQHDAAYYQQMYDSLANMGYWEGEIWNRRKNGEIYPEWLVVSAVRDGDGVITNYVGSFTDISERKAAEEKITRLAFYDPLTKLPNRRLFNDRLPHLMRTSARSNQFGALMIIDLDHFKAINDTKGHDVGDGLLVEVAKRLSDTLRESDSIVRMGGDEFLVMLENLGPHQELALMQTERVASKVLDQLTQEFLIAGFELRISASIGIELFRGTEMSSDDILKHADIALYEAKDAGRNAFRFFNSGMLEQISAAVEMAQALRDALDRRQLELYVQPQVDNDHRIVSAEALIRWRMSDGNFISPSKFIPLAERTDLILLVGDWVLEEACRFIRELQNQGIDKDFQLAVNISVQQFVQPDFTEKLKYTLDRHGVIPRHLKLELTEHLMLSDIRAAADSMRLLKLLGVGIDLDDFGTGFSSLNYLKSLPVDALKIDASFVRDLESSEESAAIVHTIILMARTLNLKVIAEGVETEGQLSYLKQHDCHLYQGFLIGRPVPQLQFRQLLQQQNLLLESD